MKNNIKFVTITNREIYNRLIKLEEIVEKNKVEIITEVNKIENLINIHSKEDNGRFNMLNWLAGILFAWLSALSVYLFIK